MGTFAVFSRSQGLNLQFGLVGTYACAKIADMLVRRRFLRLVGLVAASSSVARVASADTYPSRPLRWIVPFPAGGSTDLIARLLGEWLATRLSPPVLHQNKAGRGP